MLIFVHRQKQITLPTYFYQHISSISEHLRVYVKRICFSIAELALATATSIDLIRQVAWTISILKKLFELFKDKLLIDTSNQNSNDKSFANKLSFLDRFPFYRRIRKVNK